MMKLSTEARSYAHAIFCQREKEISVNRQNQLRHILANVSPTDPRIAEITDLLYEKHRLLMLAKVESYLTAYRTFGFALDHEDEHSISNELLNLTTDQLNFVLRLEGVDEHRMPTGNRSIDNVPQYLMDRFHIAREQAINRLQSGRFELMAEARNKPSQLIANTIAIGGDNNAPIQQGGVNNRQTTNTEKPHENKS